MLNILISLLTFALILISLFLVLVILMQRANTNSGMGSAFGGGVAESAFGTETTNILVKATKWSALAFFVIALVLYLLFMSREQGGASASDDLPEIPVVEQAAPAADETTEVDTQTVVDESVPAVEEIVETVQAQSSEAADAVEQEAGETETEEPVTETPESQAP